MKEVKTTDNNTISYEAINRGGLTERRQLERVLDNDTPAPSTIPTATSKSAQVGFDALRTITQLQQQLA